MGEGEGWGEGEGQGKGGAEAGQWENGLFNCCSSCRNCLCGYWCHCCLTMENAGRLDKSKCLHCLLYCIMPCVPTLLSRTEVREQNQIEGSVMGDVAAACCCPCCTTIQVANELDHYGK